MSNNIEKLRRAKKMSMEALGSAIGTDASTINKLEKGRMRLSQERIEKIAAALGVSPGDLIGSADDAAPSAFQQQHARQMIEVLGSAAGSLRSGAFQLTSGPIEYMEMPHVLDQARGIYALYVDGASMEPMFWHGQKVLVSQYRPPRLGDAVVVQEQRERAGPIIASLGVLRARSPEKVTLQKLNPAGNVEINAAYVVSVHRVIAYSELIGG